MSSSRTGNPSYGLFACGIQLLLVASVALVSCALPLKQDPKEAQFLEVVEVEDVNESIILRRLENLEATSGARILVLEAVNVADNSVLLEADFGGMGYYFDSSSSTWVEVPNEVQYPEGQRLIGSPTSDVLDRALFDYLPVSPIPTETIRVVIRGRKINAQGQAEDPVAAFVEITVP